MMAMIGCNAGRVLAIGLIAGLPATNISATESPPLHIQVLTRMIEARRTVSYEGDFVYVRDGQVTTLHIVRQAGHGVDSERLVTLDGPVREVVRDQDQTTCKLPMGQSTLTNSHRPPIDDAPPKDLLQHLDQITTYYEFRVGNKDRVAGREAWALEVHPRDALRYGHRFWIDTGTGLLLKSEYIGQRGEVLERILFLRIKLIDAHSTELDTPSAALTPALGPPPQATPAATTATTDEGATHWRVANLPPGFRVESDEPQTLASGTTPVRRMVYSDGLATVSVFIEPVSAGREAVNGLSKRGALHIYSVRYPHWQVTIVGEVPEATVAMFGSSLRNLDRTRD